MYEWMYENSVESKLCTKSPIDFATPIGLKITPKQKKKLRRQQEKEDKRVEEK